MQAMIKTLDKIIDIHSRLLQKNLKPADDWLVLEAQELTQELRESCVKIDEATNCITEKMLTLTA